ncbi:MAG: transposase [Shewanella sp.]|nr:transposase [Shewanella sp.]
MSYRKSNKRDFNDATTIAGAAQRQDMRFVPVKPAEQQDIQMLHRIRQLHVKNATAQSNQIRGLLSEYGMVVSQGKNKLLAGT